MAWAETAPSPQVGRIAKAESERARRGGTGLIRVWVHFVVVTLARSAAVFSKVFVFSSLPIRKVLVLPLTEAKKSKIFLSVFL